MFVLMVFLLIEAHRYRQYDVWRGRARLLQKELFAEMYAPRDADSGWQTELGEALREPSYNIPYRQAVAHRLRRVYLPLLVVVLVAWIARTTVFVSNVPWEESTSIPGIPGPIVVVSIGLFYFVLLGIAILTHTAKPVEFQE
jgi:uncharacterized membrane protein